MVNDQQKTARRPGFAATFAGAANGNGTGGHDEPRLSRRLLVITTVTVAVAAGVVGAGFVISRSARKPAAVAAATPSSSVAPRAAETVAAPSGPAQPGGTGQEPGAAVPPGGGSGPGNGAPAGGGAPALDAVGSHATTGTNTGAGTAKSNNTGTSTTTNTRVDAVTNDSSTSTIVSYSSGRCLDVTDRGGAGTHLQIWDCTGSAQQTWTFTDGTIRSLGLCIEAAGASTTNGTTVQVSTCNGGWAQQWNLNAAHDLVLTAKGKCADLKDNGSDNGTWLQLWDCGGTSNQKFHQV